MHQIEYRFSKFSRGYRPGGGRGPLGGPKNYTNVMNYPYKLTNASKCTKLNIDFQNFLVSIAQAEGGPSGPPNCTNVMNYTDKVTNASNCIKFNIDFQTFIWGIAPAEGLGPPKLHKCHELSWETITNALKCTKFNLDFQNVLWGDTPEPASLSGKEHTWAGKTRTSEIFSCWV